MAKDKGEIIKTLEALLQMRLDNRANLSPAIRKDLSSTARRDQKRIQEKAQTKAKEIDAEILKKLEALDSKESANEINAIQDLNLLWELKNILEDLNESLSKPKTLFSRKKHKPDEKEKVARMARTIDDTIAKLLDKKNLDELNSMKSLAELAEKNASIQGDKKAGIKARKEKEKIEGCIKEKVLKAFDAKLDKIEVNYISTKNKKGALDELEKMQGAIKDGHDTQYTEDKLRLIEERKKRIDNIDLKSRQKEDVTLEDLMLFQQAYILLKDVRVQAKLPNGLDDESLKRLPLVAMKPYLEHLVNVKVSAAVPILQALEGIPSDKLVAMTEMWNDIIRPMYGFKELREPQNREAHNRKIRTIEALKELLNEALSENLNDKEHKEIMAFIDYMQNDCIPKDPDKSDQPPKQGVQLGFDTKLLNLSHYAKRGDVEKLQKAIEEMTPTPSLEMLLRVLEAAFERASDKNLKVIDYLINKIVNHTEYGKQDEYNINTKLVSDYSPLQLALIQYENNVDENEPLANQYLKLAFSLVLEHGADFNEPLPGGHYTSLDYFALYAKGDDFESLLNYLEKNKKTKTVYDQLMAETSVVPDKVGVVPTLSMLHLAALGGNPKTVEGLLKREASVNTLAPGGFTPLHFAVLGGHPDVVKLLIERGAEPNQVGTDYSQQEKRVVTKVSKVKDVLVLSVEREKVLVKRTPLFIAAETGQPEIAALLLRNGGLFGKSKLHEQGLVYFTGSELAGTPTGVLIGRYFVALKRLKANLPNTVKALSDSEETLKTKTGNIKLQEKDAKTGNIKPQEKTYLIHKLYEHPNRAIQRKILANAEMNFKTRSGSPDTNLLDEIQRLKGAYLFIKDTLNAERHEYLLGKRHAPSRLEQYVDQQITHLNDLIREFNDDKHPELTVTRTDNECRALFHVFPAGEYRKTMDALAGVKGKQQSKHQAMTMVYQNYKENKFEEAAQLPSKKAEVSSTKKPK